MPSPVKGSGEEIKKKKKVDDVGGCYVVMRGDARCCVVHGAAGWCKVVQGGAGWCRVVQGGAGWCCVVLRGAAWCCVFPKIFSHFHSCCYLLQLVTSWIIKGKASSCCHVLRCTVCCCVLLRAAACCCVSTSRTRPRPSPHPFLHWMPRAAPITQHINKLNSPQHIQHHGFLIRRC